MGEKAKTKTKEPPPARKRRSDGLPPSEGRAPRPPCGDGLLSFTQPLRRTARTCMRSRGTPSIAVISTTCQPPGFTPSPDQTNESLTI
ncbi:hypothetical protein U1Q18_000386 [Sarracenia purpurea var. burkii]